MTDLTRDEVKQMIKEAIEKYSLKKTNNHVFTDFYTALSQPIEVLDLSSRLTMVFKNMNYYDGFSIHYVGDICSLSGSDLIKQPNIGHATLADLKDKLKQYGIKCWLPIYMDMDTKGWVRPK